MSKQNQQVALVTGASRGIGAAIAQRLARDGFTVIVNYTESAEPAEALVRTIQQAGGQALAAKADVSSPTDVRRLFDAAETAFGGIDVLVNNAGIMNLANIADADKRMRSIYAACGAFESCAAGCSSALAETVDPSQRGQLIARCFKDAVKAKTADPKITTDGWFQGYFDAYLVRAREKLPSADQARLDAVRKKLGFQK